MISDLSGIYAAIITPYDNSGRPSHEQLESLLQHLGARGCHGVLAAGTTGEGPSLSVEERIGLFAAVAHSSSNLRLLAGTGAASLEDAKMLGRAAFEQGALALVVIPPFFYLNPPLEGLIEFYRRLLRALPSDGKVLLYHNPSVSAPVIDMELIERLRDDFPRQIRGIKDSGGDWAYTSALLERFPDFQVLVGSDRLLSKALGAGGAGAITAIAGVFPDLLRDVFDLYHSQKPTQEAQARLDAAHQQFNDVPRVAAYKWLLASGRITSNPEVRPPLRMLTEQEMQLLSERFHMDIPMPDSIDVADLPGSA